MGSQCIWCVYVCMWQKRHFSFQNHETYKNFCTVWKLHTLSCSLYLYMYMYMYMYRVSFRKFPKRGRNQDLVKFGGQSRIKEDAIKGGVGVLPQKIFGI